MDFPGASTAVCVLGMSRSGTSLTARVLNLAGVYLGPDEELLGKDLWQLAGEGEAVMARASDANPEGFFEHYRIARLNERLLRTLGGSWREPPDLPPGWETSAVVAGEREAALALLGESFGGNALWGWKDPRNSLTLPFWQSLVPRMRYVICLRNPLDVAGSLRRRDGLSLEQSLDLWLVYVARALVNTAGRPRLLVSYESFFDALDTTIAGIARFIGREGALDCPDRRKLLARAVDERLWRNRSSSRDVTGNEKLSSDVAPLHLIAEMLTAAAPEGAGGRRDDLHAAVDLYAEELLQRLADRPGGHSGDGR